MKTLVPGLLALGSLFPLFLVWRGVWQRPAVPAPRRAVLVSVGAGLVVAVILVAVRWWPMRWNTYPEPFYGFTQSTSLLVAAAVTVVVFVAIVRWKARTTPPPGEAALERRSWASVEARGSGARTGALVAYLAAVVAAAAATGDRANPFDVPGSPSGTVFRSVFGSSSFEAAAYPGIAYALPILGCAVALWLVLVGALGLIGFTRSANGDEGRRAASRFLTGVALVGLAGTLGGVLWVSGSAIFTASQGSLTLITDAPGDYGSQDAFVASVGVVCGLVSIVSGVLWCCSALAILMRVVTPAAAPIEVAAASSLDPLHRA